MFDNVFKWLCKRLCIFVYYISDIDFDLCVLCYDDVLCVFK